MHDSRCSGSKVSFSKWFQRPLFKHLSFDLWPKQILCDRSVATLRSTHVTVELLVVVSDQYGHAEPPLLSAKILDALVQKLVF